MSKRKQPENDCSSNGYNDRLKKGIWRGKCGDPELFDNAADLLRKVKKLAHLIRESKYFIAHTGAGISVSCGIPDFRGPNGVWTLEKQGRVAESANNFDQTIPSKTHMSMVALQEANILQYLISQNVDGIHVRSGFPVDHLAEIHGNVFAEQCEKCKLVYVRKYDIKGMGLVPTGRKCQVNSIDDTTLLCYQPAQWNESTNTRTSAITILENSKSCNGNLCDMTCDWDSDLPVDALNIAEEEHRKADLCLCIGSSFRIQPASYMPLKTIRKQKKIRAGDLVIINLQNTPLDRHCTIRIYAKADDVMTMLMKELGIDIPKAPVIKPTEPSTIALSSPSQSASSLSRSSSPSSSLVRPQHRHYRHCQQRRHLH